MQKNLSNPSVAEIEKRERLQQAKNKIKLIRRQVDQSNTNKQRMLALVREYVAQRPEITIKLVKKWINQ